MPFVIVNIPVPGSYSSAVARSLVPSFPPVMRTLPSFSRVAVCSSRAALMLPFVGVNFPVPGLYISALETPTPPASSTVPSSNNVAVCCERAVPMLPSGLKPC